VVNFEDGSVVRFPADHHGNAAHDQKTLDSGKRIFR